jgi:hypothetical protein
MNAAENVIQTKKVAACTEPLGTPALVVRSQIDTKHEMRAESCNRGNRLLAQPAKKAMTIRKTAGIALDDAV